MRTSLSPASLVKRRTRALLMALPAAADGDPAALHAARVASRRLRELTPLFQDVPRKASRRLRELTRLLGRVREMDVALQLLGKDSMGSVSQLGALTAREHVERLRDTRRRLMLRRLRKLDPEKLERSLRSLAKSASEEDLEQWKRKLSQRITVRLRRLSAASKSAGALYEPERLHAVRIAAKKLRYSLEIGAELGIGRAKQLAAAIRTFQILLGELQDRQVLLQEVRAAQSKAPAHTRHGLLMLGTHIEQEARALHGEFLAERARLSEILSAVRQHVAAPLATPRRKKAVSASWPHARRTTARAASEA